MNRVIDSTPWLKILLCTLDGDAVLGSLAMWINLFTNLLCEENCSKPINTLKVSQEEAPVTSCSG